jgi:para-aminobenzoate synthetase component I
VNFHGSSFAIFPKRNALYANLVPLGVSSIFQINSLTNAIGYISYEHYTELEEIAPPTQKPFCQLPSISFAQFQNEKPFNINALKTNPLPKVSWIKSNLTKQQYLSAVASIINYIKKGTCYQVNLTRKFYGEFEQAPNPVDVFSKLYSISPNPYSMLYVLNETQAVVSSSPECFLTRTGNDVYSMPIKGTVNSKHSLNSLNNFKDKSENLMITDLVRNDIGKVSSKVWVEDFQKIETFTQVHHMHSKVRGKLFPSATNAQCIAATFPAGSMTGTPKIKAIEIANELEQTQRGIYSGCMGVVDDSLNFDLSVVIRTIILDGKKFEFQVGGAIVYDSTPQGEFDETIIKALPVLKTLQIDVDIFELSTILPGSR